MAFRMKNRVGVDSGQLLIIDPVNVKAFAKNFSYDKMVERMYPNNQNNPNAEERRAEYLYEVSKKSFPKASQNTSSMFSIQDTGGDGNFPVEKKNGKIEVQTY